MDLFGSWRALIILYLIVAGVWGIFAKMATFRLDSFTASFSILTVAWITVAVAAVPRLSWEWHAGLWVVPAAGILGGLSSLLFYGALRLAPASLIVPLSSLAMVVTIVLALIFLGESLSFKQALGILLGISAILLLTT